MGQPRASGYVFLTGFGYFLFLTSTPDFAHVCCCAWKMTRAQTTSHHQHNSAPEYASIAYDLTGTETDLDSARMSGIDLNVRGLLQNISTNRYFSL
jgi:hypothetical protein